MECENCHRTFQDEDRAASISGSIMGDEHTDCYYFCPVCQVYTVASYWDNFTGVESESIAGPVLKEDGDAQVQLIGRCPNPWDKKCRCAAHLAYFNNTLD